MKFSHNSPSKFKYSIIFTIFLLHVFQNAISQVSPSGANGGIVPMAICPGSYLSPSELYPGASGGVDVVYLISNCSTYTVAESLSWVSWTKSGKTVTLTISANSGPARSGTVSIAQLPLTIYQACGNYPGSAGTISGTSSVCPGQTGVSYYVAPIANATGYSWSLPSGASIASGANTNSITVNFSAYSASGNITVSGTGCGSGSPSPNYYVTVNSIGSASSITGDPIVCQGSLHNYSISPVSGATSYIWSIPAGATGASSTNSIDVTFGTGGGNISVYAVNSGNCYSNTSSKSVSISTVYNGYTVTGGGTTCPGIGIPVGLNGSTNGIWYRCYVDGSLSTPPVYGTGGAISLGNKWYPGTYTIRGVSAEGCEIPMSGSVVINNYSESTNPTGINTTTNPMCLGSGTTLTVSGGSLGTGANWKWYTGGCGATLVYTGNSYPVNPSSTTTYWVRAEGTCGQSSCASITLTVTTPPTITQQPSNVTICEGAPTSFTVSANGAASYQWQQNLSGWSNISGATSATYNIPSTTGMNGRSFRCIVTGPAPCNLTTPSLSAAITFSSVYNGYSVTGGGTTCPGIGIPVGLNGSTNGVWYRCYVDGSLSTPPVQGTGGAISLGNKWYPGTYIIKGVTAEGCEIPMTGSVAINNYTQSTNPIGISATANPMCLNLGTTLTVDGGSLGTGASWKWYTGGCPPNGTLVYTGNSYSVNPSSTTTYWVRAEGTCNSTACASTTITVITPPIITQQPSDVTICEGASTSFSVSATGATSYQWQQYLGSWSNIPGANGSVYNISSTLGMSGLNIRCVAIGSCTSLNSEEATIAFYQPLIPGSLSGDNTSCYGNPAGMILNQNAAGNGSGSYTYSWEKSVDSGNSWQFSEGNAVSMDPGNLYVTTWYKRKVTDNICNTFFYTAPAIKSVRDQLLPGTISGDETICYNADAGLVSITSNPSGGSNSYTYEWQRFSGYWYTVQSGPGDYDPSQLTSLTLYRRKVIDNICGTVYTDPITKNVHSELNPGAIGSNQNIPYNTAPSQIINTELPSGSVGPYSFQWKSSFDGIDWSDIEDETDLNYSPDIFTTPIRFRRYVSDICATKYSNYVSITPIMPSTDYLEGSQIPNLETRNLNLDKLVGTLQGTFNVDPTGSATYNIPLELPAGVNNLSPIISISYSSRSGSNIPGLGWSIDGLSSISRGPQTIYHDSQVKGVTLDNNDRLYLDGARLVNTCYTYGDPNALYQTENDIFSRVTPQNTTEFGPQWFKSETKSGLTFEYGNSFDSRQRISGHQQVIQWFVSKISDQFGNIINFRYIQDHSRIFPSEISYGPNKINFYYKGRSDKNISYLKGCRIEQWLLLERIEVSYNSNIIKKYEFKHSFQGPYNGYSILNEVIEYGVDATSLNSTVFSYGINETVNFSQTTYNQTHDYITYKSKLITGDYNGDGRADFLCLPDASKGATWTGMKVYTSYGNDQFTYAFSCTTSIDLSTLTDIRALDLNGDGLDDIIYESGSASSAFFYMICNGNSFTEPVNLYEQSYSAVTGMSGKSRRTTQQQEEDNERIFLRRDEYRNQIAADYNGDGIIDIFLNDSNGNWRIFSFINSEGQMTSVLNNIIGTGTIATLNGEVISGDFNGDGKTDIWSIEATGFKIYEFIGGSLSYLTGSGLISTQNYFLPGDFNSDGKVDLFIYGEVDHDWAHWQIHLSTGTGFEWHEANVHKDDLRFDYIRFGDFNGDGSPDLMVTARNQAWSGTYFYIFSQNGTNLYQHQLPAYPPATHNYYVADFDGDGHCDFICTDGLPNWWNGYQIYKSPGNTSILMDKISDGLGALTSINYFKLSEAYNYFSQKGSGAVFPVMDFRGPWSVVKTTQLDNGKGSYNTQEYYYEGAKIHLQGKGFLGFSKTKTRDLVSNLEMVKISGYSLTYFYPQLLKSFSEHIDQSDTISVTKNCWDEIVLDQAGKRIFPYIESSVNTDKLTGLKITANSTFDNYGNPTLITKNYHNGRTETTDILYDNTVSSTQWLLGLPENIEVQYSDGTESIIRIKTRQYDENNNHLLYETSFPGTSNQFTTSYLYNPNGSIQSESVTANSISRTKSYTYETDNVRIHTITDYLSHTSTNTYDVYGRLETVSDFLGNSITYQYDPLGRALTITSTTGSQKGNSYSWEDPSVTPLLARYSVTETSNDGSQTKIWYDKLGREIQAGKKAFDGSMIITAKEYNTKGQLYHITDPYFNGGTPEWNTIIFDTYGRNTDIQTPSGRNSSWAYTSGSPLVTETTAGKSVTKTYGSDGTLSSSTDAGGTITYIYYPDGKTKNITAPGNIVTSMEYDHAGNQSKLIDPSSGTVTYSYNGFGELISQVNGVKTTTIYYNQDGTIDYKVTPEGTTNYEYNTNKQLESVSSPGNVTRSFGYDTHGRLSTFTDVIPGSSSFITSFTYDNLGTKESVTHPSGITETYNYNSNGYLTSVSAGGSLRWTITAMNARQQVTSGQYGSGLNTAFGFDTYGYPASNVTGTIQNNSYNFDPVSGNLNWRQNNNYSGLREDFYYDDLDRLDSIMKNNVKTLDLNYNNKAGIALKSDIGTMVYERADKPYAVTGIDPSTGLVPSAEQVITYTSFESVNTIDEDDFSATFLYGFDNERSKMVVIEGSNTIMTRWYPTGSYIKETDGSITKEYTFIGGDSYTSAVVAIKQGETIIYYNLLRDYLGNITHVVNAETDQVVAEYSYDAWGQMRNPSTWVNYDPASEPDFIIAGRGFTGHEHLPWFNLINMNGRIYDPLLAMFLSPDNYVHNPDRTQGFNRYNYCLSNPFSYTDPSGENPIITALALLLGNFVISMLDNMINNDMDFNDALKNANYTTSYTRNFNSPKTYLSPMPLSSASGISILDLEQLNQIRLNNELPYIPFSSNGSFQQVDIGTNWNFGYQVTGYNRIWDLSFKEKHEYNLILLKAGGAITFRSGPSGGNIFGGLNYRIDPTISVNYHDKWYDVLAFMHVHWDITADVGPSPYAFRGDDFTADAIFKGRVPIFVFGWDGKIRQAGQTGIRYAQYFRNNNIDVFSLTSGNFNLWEFLLNY